MVSKSKILGRSFLIFVSIGSTKFPFLRITSCLRQLNTDQYKIVQDFTSPDQFIDFIKKADKIIIHGGLGTIFLVIKHAKFVPLIIPRISKYKEHVDNHQLFFSEYLRKKLPDNLKKYFVIDEKIEDVVDNYLKEKNKVNNFNKFLFPNKNKNILVKKLEEYINSI